MTDILPAIMPTEVTDADMAFPADALKIMPSMSEIPEMYKRGRTAWNRLANDWFFTGLDEPSFHMVPGVDGNQAHRHLSVIMRSYASKHEHKEAAFAYLCSLWFTKVVTATKTYAEGA
jgi:hypothetical protein